ncbi:hypothetical protein [Aeromicrobium sp. Sec7.5]|uniref:hypothetical protein n=1 Tax=Aeromicrobium sp. Sec7.5 TaxID=3121276 RepID=UPI002FE4499D
MRPPTTRVLRAVAAATLLLGVAACSGSDDPGTEPSPESASPSSTNDVAALEVVVTDPGGTADPQRVAGLGETVSAALASGSDRLDTCPLGAAGTFAQGPVAPLADGVTFTGDVRSSGAAGEVPTVVCFAPGFVNAEVSVLPGGVTASDLADRLSGTTMRPAFSEPQPLVGGEVVVGCSGSESSDVVTQCGATWVLGDLAIRVEVSDIGTRPQQLADYVSAALPVWVAAR